MKLRWTDSRVGLAAALAVLAAATVSAQSLVLNSGDDDTFLSGAKFTLQHAAGRYWAAIRSDDCTAVPPGSVKLYTSPDGASWSEATGSPIFSFCVQQEAQWAVRFLGDVVVAFAYYDDGTNQRRYYSKGTLGSDGTVAWQRHEDWTGLPTGATDSKLNAAIVNGKPVLWCADDASPGRITIGTSLDAPAWTTVVNTTALAAGIGASGNTGVGTNGVYSAGAVFPLRTDDPDDVIIVRATTTSPSVARSHRVVSIKYDAGTATFDAAWFNVSTEGTRLAEDVTTLVQTRASESDLYFQRRFAAARQADGQIHVVYVNQNSGDLVHYRRSAGVADYDPANDRNGWKRLFSNLDGGATAVGKVGLTAIDENNLLLFYSLQPEPETVYYKRYDGRQWGAATAIRSSVDLNGAFGTMETATGCNAGVMWNENSAAPFDVYFRVANPACTPPTVNLRSIGTAADYTNGSLTVTNGSKTVVGVGTAWITANRGPGDVIVIPCNSPPNCGAGTPYTIASVDSETSLTLTTAFAAGSGSVNKYVIRRQFQSASGNAGPALVAWEDCIDGTLNGGTCPYFAPASNSLVADNRVEIGLLYKDSVVQPPDSVDGGVLFASSVTSGTHRIVLTGAPGNRHSGAPATAGCTTSCEHVVYQGNGTSGSDATAAIHIWDSNLTLEWLEFRGVKGGLDGNAYGVIDAIAVTSSAIPQGIVLDHLLIHDFDETAATRQWDGVRVVGPCCKSVSVRNTMIWDGDRAGISGDEPGDSLWVDNCTVDWIHGTGKNTFGVFAAGSVVTARNTISTTTTQLDFGTSGPGRFTADSSNNTSEDATAPGAAARSAAPADLYAAPGADLHLRGTAGASAIDTGLNLSSTIPAIDIDGQVRPAGASWDRGADEFGGTTAVRLMSFEAAGADGAVDLSWRTGSELDNLGFHLYRSLSSSGPWTRITASLIPGLVSSPLGASYSWHDAGLANGTRYFYRLQDVDTSSVSMFHGPVSAVAVPAPVPAPSPPGEDGEGDGGGDGAGRIESDPPATHCPSWVLSAAPDALSPVCTPHGDPGSVSLDVLSRDSSSATLELRTGGFWALHDGSGRVRVFVPGFDDPADPRAAALPLRRALVDAVVGRGVALDGVRTTDEVGFPGLVPSSLGEPEMRAAGDGTVRAGRRERGAPTLERVPHPAARLLPSVFLGEAKSAVVEISPLRFDPRRGELRLFRRVVVRIVFAGREAGETGTGTVGRARPSRQRTSGDVLARIYTSRLGLHAVSFEALFPGRTRGFPASSLRLQRQGEAMAFHLEPPSHAFGPGGLLYFLADTTAASTDFSSETAWELVRSARGVSMPLLAAPPVGEEVASLPTARASFETNRVYMPGLLQAPDPWLWEALPSGSTKRVSFSLAGAAPGALGTAEIEFVLQGGTESGNPIDHHVAVSVNGVPAGATEFAGKGAHRVTLSVPASLLREGPNELAVANVPDLPAPSFVFLDRFTVAFPRRSSLAGDVFEGTWEETGTAAVTAVAAPAVVLDVTEAPPSWLTAHVTAGGTLRFRAQAGHRYLAASAAGTHSPRVAPFGRLASLRSTRNQADYLVIAPRGFLAAATPLVERRQGQGLRARAVALEQIADEFGHGQPSAIAIRDFLACAFHTWTRPSPRYALLLGDSSYDPRNFSGSSPPSPLPALWRKTSYLWTASDPQLAAVNGEDALPDLAIGRLPAGSVDEAQALVAKVLEWEDSGLGLEGKVALVADDSDLAGDFEGAVDDVARTFLVGREVAALRVRELGPATRPAIREALDSGLSLMSYVGHGGAAVWASENVWSTWDAPSLRAQSEQPVLLTLNCLNGYFVAPTVDSLAESLLKAGGRGAIAAISPSGLSLDRPAHELHRALVSELAGGRHERLGDALLAAQAAYARTGLMPELISVYHLLGDPALRIR